MNFTDKNFDVSFQFQKMIIFTVHIKVDQTEETVGCRCLKW